MAIHPELRQLFHQRKSALAISGLDGLTTDILDMLHFLDSDQCERGVAIPWVENGDLRLHTISSQLQIGV
jgi:hypothetical protein